MNPFESSESFGVPAVRSWCGGAVQVFRGTLAELRRRVPTFTRRPGWNDDLIVRQPLAEGEAEHLVARVSRNYALVQHHEVIDMVGSLLPRFEGGAACGLPATMLASPAGERMTLTVNLPSVHFVPGDGFPVAARVEVVNSVDRSCALTGGVMFLRKICSNGMVGWSGIKFRRIHKRPQVLWLVRRDLTRQFDGLHDDIGHFERLLATPVGTDGLASWVDEVVAGEWGRWDAARVFHVATAGQDGRVRYRTDMPPHRLQLEDAAPAAGACAPVGNAYHVAQALSFVASRAPWLQDRYARLAGIPRLLEPLLN